jgi:peptidoglycan/xylan/chitin deacetylase (PgdA/CDA1 family)
MTNDLQPMLTGIPADLRAANARDLRFREWKQWLIGHAAAPLSRLYGPADPAAFGILMYHRVCWPVPGLPKPTWNVTPAKFAAQLRGLLQRGFQAWPLDLILAFRARNRPIPPRVFAVTFDDGFENNLTEALPILAEYRVPATVFLATSYLGSDRPFPFDDWSAAGSHSAPTDSWRPLSLDQCRALRDSELVSLGAHTHTHADFREHPLEFALDLETCIETLATRFGVTDPVLALPYGCKATGTAGPMFSQIARQTGCLGCLSTEAGVVPLASDPFDWGRFYVGSGDTAETIAAKLDGWWDRVRGALRIARQRWAGSSSQVAGQPSVLDVGAPSTAAAREAESHADELAVAGAMAESR